MLKIGDNVNIDSIYYILYNLFTNNKGRTLAIAVA